MVGASSPSLRHITFHQEGKRTGRTSVRSRRPRVRTIHALMPPNFYDDQRISCASGRSESSGTGLLRPEAIMPYLELSHISYVKGVLPTINS